MAIAPTGNIFKAFTFGGVSSRNYGVYITGEAVYNAPEREVEMITIPGRNGALALDKGRFENIEVTYPAGIYADNETDFAAAISALRNHLCSKTGYVRLSDEYNPNEYRMAVYKSGLEAEPAQLRVAEFDIVFECQPQRYLTSGETEVTVASGNTLTNPTQFDSHPLLKLSGYGNIHIGSSAIGVASSVPLQVDLGGTGTNSVTLDVSALSTGDLIYSAKQGYPVVSVIITSTRQSIYNHEFAFIYMQSVTNGTVNAGTIDGRRLRVDIQPDLSMGLLKGTSGTLTTTVVMQIGRPNTGTGVVEYAYVTFTVVTTYNGSDTITISASESSTGVDNNLSYSYSYTQQGYYGLAAVAIPSPCYIDLDSGEAYGEVSGTMMSVNSFVSMPPELPALKSGSNTITFDNTITSLKVTPRWWKV